MPNLGPLEILLILVAILLLFGARKLPELARSLGRSARIFKSEVDEMNKESHATKAQQPELMQPRADAQFWESPQAQPGVTQYQQPTPQQPNAGQYQQPTPQQQYSHDNYPNGTQQQ
ncbi:MAG: Sec-independent protein translocase subunit TatA [Corynebacterium sp.]|nr:Sec-independent protein translocase subunit TatA [Corynebacterium sp.]